ncbi:unnamed protein product [Blepharisma stoltei]|uniref:RRM domain-containing protein n=1 Tax=Blepharisma stoltei TaxID=1481888 RepID=A0AAU9KD42_9CILI|nr:unnamed protein product [Blepharisma stoltei]
MVLFTYAKQLGRAVVLKKASTLLFKPSFVFSACRQFATPLSAFSFRRFNTFSGDNSESSTSEATQTSFSNPDTDLFIGGVDWSATEEDIKGFFKNTGGVVGVRIPKNLEGKSRGFAFVRFENAEKAKAGLQLSGKEFLGRMVRVSKIGEKNESVSCKIFVANISNTISNEMLTQHFSQYGQVLTSKIVTDYEGKPKGFGFIEFAAPEEAKKALSSSGVELDGRALVVNASLPKSKLPRRDSGDRYEKRDFAGRENRYGDSERENRYGDFEREDRGYGRKDNYDRRDYGRRDDREGYGRKRDY